MDFAELLLKLEEGNVKEMLNMKPAGLYDFLKILRKFLRA